MLKLTHGIVSWLAGREVPVRSVAFAFPRPSFAADYSILFPAPIDFCGPLSQITFHAELAKVRPKRSASDARSFLERAPRDWIFTSYHQHALRLKVRELLHVDLGRTLDDVSSRLHMSSRTLMRKLQQEGLSFQGIKDELRRDLAILHLVRNDSSLEEISDALGFSAPAVFHRAFRHWTGMTPRTIPGGAAGHFPWGYALTCAPKSGHPDRAHWISSFRSQRDFTPRLLVEEAQVGVVGRHSLEQRTGLRQQVAVQLPRFARP